MIIAGKCPPKPEELRDAGEKGFENVELYLEKRHLDNMEESVRSVQNSKVDVVSVHTPHVTLEEKQYLVKASELAARLSAFLCVHSHQIQYCHFEKIQHLDYVSRHGFENQPGQSSWYFRNAVLEQDFDAVLDIAHLYMAEQKFYKKLEQVLAEYTRQIEVVHLCDSTRIEDGLGFGQGEIDMERSCRIISGSQFDGTVVLEVMPEEQMEALEKWKEYIQ